MSEFDEYIVHGEPGQKEKADTWQTAIGLQDVDGLKVSPYLLDTARQHIEGYITIDEARERIKVYYETKSGHNEVDEEGDKASVNIAKILSEPSFAFSLVGLTSIHRRIFDGVFKFAGQLRKVELSKKEWVLDGNASVSYQPAIDLREAVEYDLFREKEFDYSNRPMAEIIKHLSQFVADLWQIHPFREGNTRTTAVFLIKYLRSMGIPATNDMFKEHSWYFRNALVRANYRNALKGIEPTIEYLVLFLNNLIIGENNELKNRYIHIRWSDAKPQNEVSKDAKPQNESYKPQLTVKEKAVVDIIIGNPRVLIDEIARMTGISDSTIDRIIKSLKGKGIIERKGQKNNPQWIVKEE